MSIFRSRPARRRALLAAGAVVAVAAGVGVVSGMPPATARQEAAHASFRCALPGGGQVDTPVEVGLSVPDAATAGADLTAEPSATITLPADAVAALKAVGAQAVSGAATAELVLRQGGEDTPLGPAELTAAAAPLPAEGTVALKLTGAPVTARPAAGTAELVLTGLTARLRASAEGKADQAVDCGAYAGGDTLGSVAVTAAPAQRAPATPVAPLAEPNAPAAPPGIKTTFDITARSKLAKVGVELTITGTLESYINAAPAPGQPGLTGTLDLNDLKDVYLVVFRFMPVLNDIKFQESTVSGEAKVILGADPVAEIDVVSKARLRLENVRQDGVDLRVGTKCAAVMELPLKGPVALVPGKTSTFKTKGKLSGFSGCGTKEDLDRLVSGLVAGPDNPTTVELYLKCIETNCAPPR